MNPTTTGETIVQEITIHAPAERVFEALVDPQARMQWWGREGRFRTTRCTSDLRVGGAWTMDFETPRGTSGIAGRYRAIERPHLLAFTWLPNWYPGATETLVQFDLTEHAGATVVRVTHSGLTSEGDRANHRGWPDVLSWLRSYLEQAA